MKRLSCLLLALVMMLSVALTGCGEDPSNVGGNLDTLGTTEATQGDSLSMGRLEGGVYTNSYVGYGCTLDESWTFYSAEELQELPSAVNDALEGSELGEALAGVDQFTDMMAENVDQLVTMNVLYQKLTATQRLAYAAMSEEQIVDETLKELETMKEAYSQAGIEVSSMTKKTVTFLGEERTAIYTVADMSGTAYYILQLFDYNLGEYYVTLTLGSFVEDGTEDMLDLFYEVK